MPLVLDDPRKLLLATDSHALVTGGPGCGKTTIALVKAEKRINDGLLDGQSVLFLSFSRAAVTRIEEASKIHIPKELHARLSIQTFHSFFWEVLRGYGYLLGSPKHLRILLPHDERALRNGKEGEDATWNAHREQLFRDDGLVAFDLFAPKAHELFEKGRRIRTLFASRHPLIIVDEAQDTAEDQWQSLRFLAETSQLICLADLDQQIYDFRPGVSAERLKHIMTALSPLRIDLATENHRSSGLEILKFGNDILLSTPTGKKYKGVSQLKFRPQRDYRDSSIRSSVGIISQNIKKATGEAPKNIAMLASWGKGVTVISRALNGNGSNRIAHRVVIDEAPVLLASRLVAFLMEPHESDDKILLDLSDALKLGATVFQSKGGTTALASANTLLGQAGIASSGQQPRARSAGQSLLSTLRKLRAYKFSGDPVRDWISTRKMLSESGSTVWKEIAEFAEQLIAFQRGQRIASGLAELWQTQGNYAHAREALDAALTQDQLLSDANDLHGIHVMTLHKSKGKEFDGVIILDDAHSCPLVSREQPPYRRGRKLLRVGITRARVHVMLLTDLFTPCPLLNGHNL